MNSFRDGDATRKNTAAVKLMCSQVFLASCVVHCHAVHGDDYAASPEAAKPSETIGETASPLGLARINFRPVTSERLGAPIDTTEAVHVNSTRHHTLPQSAHVRPFNRGKKKRAATLE